MNLVRCFIGIGSNLENPVLQVSTALGELAHLPQTTLVQHSSLYRGAPMGPQDQPDYINAVGMLDTTLSARELLQKLLEIEQAHGRVRGSQRWAARTLDLDILLFGEEVIEDETLTVPHPGIGERNFVLYPLLEIAPDLVIPRRGSLVALIAGCARGDLVKLPDGLGGNMSWNP